MRNAFDLLPNRVHIIKKILLLPYRSPQFKKNILYGVYYSHFHIIISNYTFYSGIIASKAMLLLLNVIEMIVL
jgi:hypothetical protein